MLHFKKIKILLILISLILLFWLNSSFWNSGITNNSTDKNNKITEVISSNIKLEWILNEFYTNLDIKITKTERKITYIYSLYSKITAIKNRILAKWDLTNSQKNIFSYIENSLEQKISYLQLLLIEEEKERLLILKKSKHIKTPEKVKSLYYTAYAAWNKNKLDSLYNLIDKTEINSVTIDIKDVSWYVSFDFDNDNFDKIKPVSNNRLNNIEELIKDLHDRNIYVIWRIVVFKDKLLASNRPDLAIKWTDQKTVWNDYAWNKYMDPYSKEVWDYNANIANAAYDMWFDELNFDYVRFPSDWKISSTYYPFAKTIINKNPKWWKVMVIDKFSHYFTKKMREKEPEIVLSADVFGLVTRLDLMQIWQNLESFMLNFDYVWPMVYPSHYWSSFLWYSPADNYPYEIILDAMKNSKIKVDNLNKEILLAKEENRKIKINSAISSDIELENVESMDLSVIRPWFQWFSCTRCAWATNYNRYKFRRQIQALNDYDLDSWWVWNSWSNYYFERYNK